MTRPRVVVLVGTRPEAIKMAPVVRALREGLPGAETVLLATGQHDELLLRALAPFDLVPDRNLSIMEEGQGVRDVALRCLELLPPVLDELDPALLLVQGDTASVFFGAVGAFLGQVPVGHVEAGLRSGDLSRPFPEEGFRRMVSAVASLHFAPTARAATTLRGEGIPGDRIHHTGNTVVDALHQMDRSGRAVENPHLADLLGRVEDGSRPLALVTLHRRESFGAPMERAMTAVRTLAESRSDLEVVYPVHPNPAVGGPARRILGDHPRIHLAEPLSYPDLVAALARADLVLTDSGGIQEEAPSFGVPLLVLREVTERPEGVEAGVAELVGTDPELILRRGLALLAEDRKGRALRRMKNPYGDGKAAWRIAAVVARELGLAAPSEIEVPIPGGPTPAPAASIPSTPEAEP
ncbi:MAG: UDP-N-acetylglucosamine 2-epimerase (non-hydrolyzing) [Gemmatimonadales bacterium]|nr:MAG: UDP-N-acetylglucosamine 2-epimerase (non-hydrolyzing) [Gemmatimonadales bacterium]